MKEKRTIYHIIVDKSGSMSDCIDQTIHGFNEQIQMIRGLENQFPEQEWRLGLTTFNGVVEHKYFMQSTDAAAQMDRYNYRPSGSTALLDAIGETILRIDDLKNLSDEQIETTVVVVILTDGHENASQKFTLAQINEMISNRENTGKWTFSYIGATLDAVDVAERMAIKRENSMHFQKEDMNNQVWNKLNKSLVNYSDKKRRGENLDQLF